MSGVVGENGPEMDGWRLPPRVPATHCGEWQEDLHSCSVCGEAVTSPASAAQIRRLAAANAERWRQTLDLLAQS